MYEADGMAPEHARRAAADVMRRPEEALAVHARAELGVDPASWRRRRRPALSSLVCFLFGALLPVIPWLWSASGHGADGRLGRHRRRRRGRRRGVIGRLAERSIVRSIAPPGADRARRLRA